MSNAITVGDALLWVGIPLGLVLLAALLLYIVSLFNPFRSGH